MWTKAHSSGICVCLLTERVSICVVGSMKSGVDQKKLQAHYERIFTGWVSESYCLKFRTSLPVSEGIWDNPWVSSSVWNLRMSESVWECCFRKREISRCPNHVIGSKRKVYFCAEQVHLGIERADIVENAGTWLFCPIRIPKPLILFWRLTIFVSETSFLEVNFWSYFSWIFHYVLFATWSQNMGV